VAAANGQRQRRVVIACQGGGSHTAFTAGVLKRLLGADELTGYEVAGMSGTSGGAVCALLAWYARHCCINRSRDHQTGKSFAGLRPMQPGSALTPPKAHAAAAERTGGRRIYGLMIT